MKTTRKSLSPVFLAALGTLGLLTAGLGVASADGKRSGNKQRCVPAHVKKMLPTYDLNKNGRLDRDERRAMKTAKRQADLATYDADGDGTLSETERKTLHHNRAVERFESLDVNRDAEISAAEASGSCTPVERHFAKLDTDGSGSISWAEFAAAPKKRRGRGRRGPPGKRGGAQ